MYIPKKLSKPHQGHDYNDQFPNSPPFPHIIIISVIIFNMDSQSKFQLYNQV